MFQIDRAQLLKRYQIKCCNSYEKLNILTKELTLVNLGFNLLLLVSLLCMVLYSIATAIFSHYSTHDSRCNEDYHRCEKLTGLIILIRIFQTCIYLAYTICAALMCLFAQRMHRTIKDIHQNWETSYFEIFLHCFALVFPVIILTAILITSHGNMLEKGQKQAKQHGNESIRDINILLYSVLEIAKSVIYLILLFIVTKYSVNKRK